MKTSVRKYDTIVLGLLKKEEERRIMPNRDFFTSHGAYVNCAYSDVIQSFDWKSPIEQDGGV